MDHACPTPRSRRPLAVWFPFAGIVAIVLLSFVTGRGPVTEGHAAQVGVNAELPADIFIDPTACTASAVNIGDLVPGTDPWKTAKDQGGQACDISFGTTNGTDGTTLSMLEDPANAAGAAMKCGVGSCTGSSIGDFENASAEPAIGTASFGSQLLSTGGAASAVWPLEPGVQDVQDTASPACTTAAVGTGLCSFTFGATAAVATPPGAYQAHANLVVLAN